MAAPELMALGVIALMMAAFVWARFRYDLVAATALLVALAVGIVPYDAAFTGFSDDIVIIVGSALLVSAGVARSGIMEAAIQRYAPTLSSTRAQLTLLVLLVTVLSAFVKNIGALAIMIPIAFQFARRSGVSPSVFLMPMAFGSLLVDESNAWCPRFTAAMMRSGSAVQTTGLGWVLCSARKRLMAAWRSTREWNAPRWRRRLKSLAKKPSTALSHEAEVG